LCESNFFKEIKDLSAAQYACAQRSPQIVCKEGKVTAARSKTRTDVLSRPNISTKTVEKYGLHKIKALRFSAVESTTSRERNTIAHNVVHKKCEKLGKVQTREEPKILPHF
jgi:hypothetical protein